MKICLKIGLKPLCFQSNIFYRNIYFGLYDGLKNIYQDEYLASIYYYLHFQYNGWFFFACMGLFFHFAALKSTDNPFFKKRSICFYSLYSGILPINFMVKHSYLVIRYHNRSGSNSSLYLVSFFVYDIKNKKESFKNYPIVLRYILGFVALALSIKFLLQLGITIPLISQLAFGFRPIVIAYLHLVLLAFVSLFLLFYIYANDFIKFNKSIKIGLLLFAIGVFLNEIVLAIQGIASFSYTVIPSVNELLLELQLYWF